jgi:hypothetical protein
MQGLSRYLSKVLLSLLPPRQCYAKMRKTTKRHVFKPTSHAPSRLRKRTHRLPRLLPRSPRIKARLLTWEPRLLPRPLLLLSTPAPAFWRSGPSLSNNVSRGSNGYTAQRIHTSQDHHQSVGRHQERRAVRPLLRRDQVGERTRRRWIRKLACFGMESCAKRPICTSNLDITERSSGCQR